MPANHHARGEERRAGEFLDRANYGPSVVRVMVCYKLETACLFAFLPLVIEDDQVHA